MKENGTCVTSTMETKFEYFLNGFLKLIYARTVILLLQYNWWNLCQLRCAGSQYHFLQLPVTALVLIIRSDTKI